MGAGVVTVKRQSKVALHQLRDAFDEALSGIGFGRAGVVYTRPLRPGVAGWLGLNRALRDPDNFAAINPVIGVRHERVMQLVAELAGRSNRHDTPTFARPLGYLMPDARYTEWTAETEADIPRIASEIARALSVYGVPRMVEWSELETLLTAIRTFGPVLEDEAERVPVMLALLGRPGEAAREASAYLDRMAERLSYARYRAFAESFDRYLAGRARTA